MRSSLLPILFLTGCFYISPKHHSDELDPDADGVPFGDDCAPEDGSASAAIEVFADADGDGFGDPGAPMMACGSHAGFVENAGDCDDEDAATNPDGTERCDGLGGDEDCDGEVDEAGADGELVFYVDLDGDGWGSDLQTVSACTIPSDASAVGGDCDDGDAQRNPDVAETCTGVDDDCDALVDEDDPDLVGTVLFYADIDGDGFGDPDAPMAACEAPAGAVADATDCDDTDAHVNPLATEACDDDQIDEDCDGERNESGEQRPYYLDADADGYGLSDSSLLACALPEGYAALPDDCNDAHAGIHPGAAEICDAANVDENCNGLADDDDDGPKIGTSYHPDADGDGYGDANTLGVVYCDSVPVDLLPDGSDCDDTSAAFRPGAPELCDTLDNDCDGLIDDDDVPVDPTGWYPDGDGDGFGAGASAAVLACVAPAGYADGATDCDDGDPATHPDAEEVCGGGDDDCDGLTDDADPSLVGGDTAYLDVDGDGFGGAPIRYCTLPAGAVLDGDDCDDTDLLTHPGAVETCAPGDRDCDGSADAGAVDTVPFYADADGDDYGDASVSVFACSAPSGYVASGLDCDDGDGDIHPGAIEVCGGGDEDCDGRVDDADPDLAGSLTTFYLDGDGDGYGGPVEIEACVAPAGTVANHDDCRDNDPTVNPDAVEVCDPFDVDEDCDGVADDASATAASKVDYYEDLDGDGYGDAVAGQACAPPAGFVAIDGDCDDTAPTTNPASPELCDPDQADEDCDGVADDDDDDALGRTDFWPDVDDDTWGDEAAMPLPRCVEPAGSWTDRGQDCDDALAYVNPDGFEFANDGVDGNCDGVDAVCGDSLLLVPTYYDTVASAVAATCDGDQVILLSDVYFEAGIDVTTDISISAWDPTNPPTIDAQGADTIFLTNADVELHDLNLTGGHATDGGCVRQTGGSLVIDGVSFDSCTATDRGGALYADTNVSVDNSMFIGNSGARGGAAYVSAIGDLSIENTLLASNTASGSGGALYVRGIIDLFQVVVDANYADSFGGGIYVLDWIDIEMDQVVVSNNAALDRAGGMMIHNPDNLQADANIIDVQFVANQATNQGGGLLLLDVGDSDLNLIGVLFQDNVSGDAGGGLYLENVDQTALDDCIFDNNTATDGAAAYAVSVNVDWDRSTVVGNTATAGSIVKVLDAYQDTRAIDRMELIGNSATGPTVLVEAGQPIDVMRMDFAADPSPTSANLRIEGPVIAYNVLGTGAATHQVELETRPGVILTGLYNSTLVGGSDAGVAVFGAGAAVLVNNLVVGHPFGVEVPGGASVTADYNDAFGNTTDWSGIPDPGGTNLSVDPLFVGGGDYHLQNGSPLRNAGDPTLVDPDGSPSDVGYYGGPFAE